MTESVNPPPTLLQPYSYIISIIFIRQYIDTTAPQEASSVWYIAAFSITFTACASVTIYVC